MKNIFTILFIGFAFIANANNIKVNTEKELSQAIKNAAPGDTIIMANKTWKDIKIGFYAKGTSDNHITLKAETPGKVLLTGNSRLIIFGDYLNVEGLWFKDGDTNGKSVITFKRNNEELANFSRVTNCAIINYNPIQRDIEYKWIELWGKNNRVDHCSFFGKTNKGPVLIVGLKGNEANYDNNHRIDHNYFGHRPPLGSNGGETIRIGTSHVSMQTSKTIVELNTFEKCDGEVEIISNKTCDNIFRNNLFVESKGTLTLRHGNRALVEGNVFIGNNLPNTGGIRVINEGHVVQNNILIGLKGDSFRAPLTIMNGVPNGPANRYNQVKDATIQNNTFINCTPVELAEGSDDERSAVPESTTFANNIFYSEDKLDLLSISDDISGIDFSGNKIQGDIKVDQKGFDKVTIEWEKTKAYPIPTSSSSNALKVEATKSALKTDITGALRSYATAGAVIPGNKTLPLALSTKPGVTWQLEIPEAYKEASPEEYTTIEVEPGENTLIKAIKKAQPYSHIKLKEGVYTVTKGIKITNDVIIEGASKDLTYIKVSNNTTKAPTYIFKVEGGKNFTIKNLEIDGSANLEAKYAIISPSEPTAQSFNLTVDNVRVKNFTHKVGSFFKAYKGTFAEKIEIKNSEIINCTRGLNLSYEKDDKGIYNAEEIKIENTLFKDISEFAINYYRGGNDESTLGGKLVIDHCLFYNNSTDTNGNVLKTNGIVSVKITNSIFAGSPEAKYAVNLKGHKNSISYSAVFNSGEVKTTQEAKASNILTKNPKFSNYKTFTLKKKSKLKGAGTDGKDIGLLN
ncbi:poly(beta-D-mannuronate) lyase [Mesonia phycicola]|uniref:Poly(Beta-D-mannuronate) lyase n=1 Tax=Mesonia phycicola TaxID=579105 RepID=A0A1M6H0V5_9FLAO|nr:polysaccharide lyase 6 family protein [Mesonia phycicola]SHJ15847.1 poly(beta-D-mannuronate) lyase [Mesonia phycicola]